MAWSHDPLVLVKRIGKSRCVLAVAFPVRLVQPRFALGEETREVNSSLGKLGCDEHDQSSNILSDMLRLSKTEDFKRFEQAQLCYVYTTQPIVVGTEQDARGT